MKQINKPNKDEIIKGKLISEEKDCKSTFQKGKLLTNNKTYPAYTCQDNNIQKILYQYNNIPDIEFIVQKHDYGLIIKAVNDEDFKLCLEKVQEAEFKLKKLEIKASNEFYEIFNKKESFKHSFNGMMTVYILKNIDFEHRTFTSFSEGRDSFVKCIHQIKDNSDNAKLFFNDSALEEYVWNFLSRNFYRQYRMRITPKSEIEEVHLGENGSGCNINNVKSLYISPRLILHPLTKDGYWENYTALNRRVPFKPFTIGHLLETGFVLNNKQIPLEERLIKIIDINDFYSYFTKELTINEKKFLKQYLDYTQKHENDKKAYNNIPLLLPQFRYGGLNVQHKYRVDFLIFDSYDPTKSAFIEVDDPKHSQLYDLDAEKRNTFEQCYHFQYYSIRPQDNINIFFEENILPLLD